MQEFQVGDLVKVVDVDGGRDTNWYKLGEVYEVRGVLDFEDAVLVKGVEGEFYSDFTPSIDDYSNEIWIGAEHISHPDNPEIERFLAELAEARKVIEEFQQEGEDDHFKVGDRVTISVFSKYYGLGEVNPYCEGTITKYAPEELYADFAYRVEWDNGRINAYREGDLVPALEDGGVEEESERKLTIIFEPEQIFLAAEFLVENNPYVDGDVFFFQNRIYDEIEKCAGKNSIVSTLGFYALFTKEGDTVFVEVLVDPALGGLHEQDEATIENGTLVLEF